MKKNIFLICLLLLTFSQNKSFSYVGDITPLFTWTTISTFGLYDTKNDRFVQSFDVDASFIIINGGVAYKNIKYIDAKKWSFYVGLGLGSIVQLQAGFSGDGFSIRNRYDIPPMVIIELFLDDYYDTPGWLYQITVSPSIEKYFGNDKMNWYFGLGIGFSINNIEGML